MWIIREDINQQLEVLFESFVLKNDLNLFNKNEFTKDNPIINIDVRIKKIQNTSHNLKISAISYINDSVSHSMEFSNALERYNMLLSNNDLAARKSLLCLAKTKTLILLASIGPKVPSEIFKETIFVFEKLLTLMYDLTNEFVDLILKKYSSYELDMLFHEINGKTNADCDILAKTLYVSNRNLGLKNEELSQLCFHFLRKNDTFQYVGKCLYIFILKLKIFEEFQISEYELFPFLCRVSVILSVITYVYETWLSLEFLDPNIMCIINQLSYKEKNGKSKPVMENFSTFFPLYENLKDKAFSVDSQVSKFSQEGIIYIMKAGNKSRIIKRWLIDNGIINKCMKGLFDCFRLCVNDDDFERNFLDELLVNDVTTDLSSGVSYSKKICPIGNYACFSEALRFIISLIAVQDDPKSRFLLGDCFDKNFLSKVSDSFPVNSNKTLAKTFLRVYVLLTFIILNFLPNIEIFCNILLLLLAQDGNSYFLTIFHLNMNESLSDDRLNDRHLISKVKLFTIRFIKTVLRVPLYSTNIGTRLFFSASYFKIDSSNTNIMKMNLSLQFLRIKSSVLSSCLINNDKLENNLVSSCYNKNVSFLHDLLELKSDSDFLNNNHECRILKYESQNNFNESFKYPFAFFLMETLKRFQDNSVGFNIHLCDVVQLLLAQSTYDIENFVSDEQSQISQIIENLYRRTIDYYKEWQNSYDDHMQMEINRNLFTEFYFELFLNTKSKVFLKINNILDSNSEPATTSLI